MNNGRLVLGIIIGAAVGIVAGLLVAPNSGGKTIKKIKKESSKIKGELERETNQMLNSIKREFSEKAKDISKEGAKTFNNLKDTVKKY